MSNIYLSHYYKLTNTFMAEAEPSNLGPVEQFPIWIWFVPVVVLPGAWFVGVKLFKKKKNGKE